MIDTFRRLHESGCFVIPNPWDIGSARILEQLGFKALATTSSGFAWTLGKPDNHVTLEQALAHIRGIASAVGVPVNADFEGGFSREPEGVALNISRALSTGIAGISIEDSSGETESPLYEFPFALERIVAARRTIDESGTGILLTARTEGFICGRPDIAETLRRLEAFAEAGADCVYAPGVRSLNDISAIVRAVAPRAVNVLVSSGFTTVSQLADLGVRRISVGGALARKAWTGFLSAANAMQDGRFDELDEAVSGDRMNDMFGS